MMSSEQILLLGRRRVNGARPTLFTATPCRHRRSTRSHGFTLLELLVVLFIIGITLSFAMLSVGDRGREQVVEQEVERLLGRLKLAGQESVLQGQEMALEISDDGYKFIVLNEDEWQDVKDDEILRPHNIPAEFRLKLKIEGESIVLDSEKKNSDEPETPPRIYLLSSGEMTPFELTFDDEFGNDYRITGAVNGKLKMARVARETKG